MRSNEAGEEHEVVGRSFHLILEIGLELEESAETAKIGQDFRSEGGADVRFDPADKLVAGINVHS